VPPQPSRNSRSQHKSEHQMGAACVAPNLFARFPVARMVSARLTGRGTRTPPRSRVRSSARGFPRSSIATTSPSTRRIIQPSAMRTSTSAVRSWAAISTRRIRQYPNYISIRRAAVSWRRAACCWPTSPIHGRGIRPASSIHRRRRRHLVRFFRATSRKKSCPHLMLGSDGWTASLRCQKAAPLARPSLLGVFLARRLSC
jgi:hypothetical protein